MLRSTQINSKERLLTALQRGRTDRVPVCAMFGLQFISKTLGIRPPVGAHLVCTGFEPLLRWQETMGFDPVGFAFIAQEPENFGIAEAIFSWPESARRAWQVAETALGRTEDGPEIERVYTTPGGRLTAHYRRGAFQKWVLEPPTIKQKKVFACYAIAPIPMRWT